jgi:hypothetical protein
MYSQLKIHLGLPQNQFIGFGAPYTIGISILLAKMKKTWLLEHGQMSGIMKGLLTGQSNSIARVSLSEALLL